MTYLKAVLVLAFAGLPVLLLSACSPGRPDAKPAFVARVNGEDISVSRFRYTRSRAEAERPGESLEAARLIDGLIEQTLFAQKAAELELDRTGRVAAALEDARAAILARAYVQSVAIYAPNAAEIDRFYDENPHFFSGRRRFRVFELAVLAPPERIAALRERARRATDLQQLAQWLKTKGIAFNVGGVTKTSDQLAPQLLAALQEMRDGEVKVLETGAGASVLQLVQSELAPVSREAAAPLIEAMLRARHEQEIAARESRFLRKGAAIEYGIKLTTSAASPTADRP